MIYDPGMAKNKRSRNQAYRDLRNRIEKELRVEIAKEVREQLIAEAREQVCAERNSVWGPLNVHEYVPVVRDSRMFEDCVVCGQTKAADLPTDPILRRAYLERVVTPETVQQITKERALARQQEKGADFMGNINGGGPHDWQQAGNPSSFHGSPPFAPPSSGGLMEELLQKAVIPQRQLMDTLVINGKTAEFKGSIKGLSADKIVLNEAVPDGVAFAFSQAQIDAMLKPAAMTITFDRDDDKDSFRNLLALTGGLPVVPSDLASRMKVNPA